MKLGYFPVPPEVVDQICKFLVTQPAGVADGITTFLDPCCGKGLAAAGFALRLGIEHRHVYGIELDEKRGEDAKAYMPQATILSPCDIAGARYSFGAFSVVWLNPPYDDEIGGGGREEQSFLSHTIPAVAKGGILMLALPWNVLRSAHGVHAMLMTNFENIHVIPYCVRKYEEVIVIAKRREKMVEGHKLAWHREHKYFGGASDHKDAPRYLVPLVPDGKRSFTKVEYTEDELANVMAASRLNRIFDAPKPRPEPRPGLQLSAGQRALTLAGGFLNRTITKGGETILIKASPGKETFVKSQEEAEIFNKTTGESEIKVTTILSERIVLAVRVLTEQGNIHEVRSGTKDTGGEDGEDAVGNSQPAELRLFAGRADCRASRTTG